VSVNGKRLPRGSRGCPVKPKIATVWHCRPAVALIAATFTRHVRWRALRAPSGVLSGHPWPQSRATAEQPSQELRSPDTLGRERLQLRPLHPQPRLQLRLLSLRSPRRSSWRFAPDIMSFALSLGLRAARKFTLRIQLRARWAHFVRGLRTSCAPAHPAGRL
jgi:hypothetical protein